MAEKSRYWVAVVYNENMLEDWQDRIDDIIELPFAYCVHDKDTLSDSVEGRKVHTHIMVANNGPTTYKRMMALFEKLSAPGKSCVNTCKDVFSVRRMYNYLIHDTDSCRNAGKYLYDVSERICGNNFDIGEYEQLSAQEKDNMILEMSQIIVDNGFSNFMHFYKFILSNYDTSYLSLIRTNSGFFDRLIKGNYHIRLEVENKSDI